jgi:hypothetical protein
MPAFLLSALWLELPVWLLIIGALSAIAQLIGLFQLGKRIVTSTAFQLLPGGRSVKWLLVLVFLSYCIKLLLQAGSTFPELSELAFGFRQIVIAYLHLVLLCIVSIFLLVYLLLDQIFENLIIYRSALWIFVMMVYLNEMILAVQGIASFSYQSISGANYILLCIAGGLMIGALLLFLSLLKKSRLMR